LTDLTGENILLSRLSGHEQRAQAAAIIGIAEQLGDPACREYITARFGGMTKPEDVAAMLNRVFVELGNRHTRAPRRVQIATLLFWGEHWVSGEPV
jgi:hypothetical protein